MILKPVSTEKAVKLLDMDNTIIFEVGARYAKPEIKKQVESLFAVKVEKVRTSTVGNKKFAFVKLKKENLAIDLATKLGMI